jgi:hypothetical protein
MELRIHDEDLRSKAVRWMGALQRQTRAVWTAQGEDPEAVAIECSFAATAVRVLDLEVFQRVHGSDYEQLRASHPAGRVVDGMTLVRNAEMHLPVVLTPASNTIVGVETRRNGDPRHYVFCDATWPRYDEVPHAVRSDPRAAARCHNGYRQALAGKPVTETFIIALSLFHELDPTLPPRNPAGELVGFPLARPKGPRYSYHRLHPDEPPLDEVVARLRAAVEQRSPRGGWREIHYVIRAPHDGHVARFAGFEQARWAWAGGREGVTSWVDYPALVTRDVERGYPCYLVDGDARTRLTMRDGTLEVEGSSLSSISLPEAPACPDWWQIGLALSFDPCAHASSRGIDWRDVVASDRLAVLR